MDKDGKVWLEYSITDISINQSGRSGCIGQKILATTYKRRRGRSMLAYEDVGGRERPDHALF